jgi:hypothetical protein
MAVERAEHHPPAIQLLGWLSRRIVLPASADVLPSLRRSEDMGLLALDVSRFGVVMSADSQPIDLLDRRFRVLRGHPQIRPIIIRRAAGFAGFIGYVGRSSIGGRSTREWLERFSANHSADPLGGFCPKLAASLTDEWRRHRLRSGLIIFVSGVEGSEVRFWFIHNTRGLHPDGSYIQPGVTFGATNDFDDNYVAPALAPGQTKEQLLRTRLWFFRNGALVPSSLVFDKFAEIMQTIYVHGIRGFSPIASLDDLGYYDRQRMEFTKRLCTKKYGISSLNPSPLGGEVHVLGVTRTGVIREYPKHRTQIKTL